MAELFVAMNDFESALLQARQREIALPALFNALAIAQIAVPSGQAVEADWSGFQPLLFDKEGTPMLGCFSAKERAAEFADLAPFALVLPGAELLRRMLPGHGLVVNPGLDVGFDISPEGIQNIVRGLVP